MLIDQFVCEPDATAVKFEETERGLSVTQDTPVSQIK